MSSLGTLYDTVAAALAATSETSTTEVVFGTRERGRQINQGVLVANRVVFVPLDTAKVGDLAPPRQPGGQTRRFASMRVAATVYVWAYDGSTATAAASERAQYDAVCALLGRVVSAILAAREGEVVLGAVQRTAPDKRELVLGQEWQFTLTLVEDFDDEPHTAVVRDPQLTTTFTPLSEA